jgi:hypothetical protein
MFLNRQASNEKANLTAQSANSSLQQEPERLDQNAPPVPARQAALALTQAERQEMICAFQRQALASDNLLQANLDILNADLMTLAMGQRGVLDVLLARTDGPLASPELMRYTEMTLRLARQIERLSQSLRRPPPEAARRGF